MRAPVAVAALIVATALSAAAEPVALDDHAWQAAETAVKSAVAADKNPVTELHRMSWLHVPAFSLTRADKTAQLAVVAGGKVQLAGKHANRRVVEIMKAERMLERRAFSAADLVLLLHGFGEPPATINTAIDQQTTGHGTIDGFDPKLSWSGAGGRTSACLTVWTSRPTAQRGADRTPMLHLYKATLTISPTYALSWNVAPIDVADKGGSGKE